MSAFYTDVQTPARLAKRRRAMRAVARGLVVGHYRMVRRAAAVAPADPSAALTAGGGDDESQPDEAVPSGAGAGCLSVPCDPRWGDPARKADTESTNGEHMERKHYDTGARGAMDLVHDLGLTLMGIGREYEGGLNPAGPAMAMEQVLDWTVDQGHDRDAVVHHLAYLLRQRGAMAAAAELEEVPA